MEFKQTKDIGLQNYYRFLTKDLEYVEHKKKVKKLHQNRVSKPIISKQKYLIDTQISELPELICRELAKKEKIDSKYNLCTLCNTVIDASAIKAHLESKSHKKHKTTSKNTDDAQVIIVCDEQEMIAQRFNALKRKCKKVKYYIEVTCLKNESTFTKDTISGPNLS